MNKVREEHKISYDFASKVYKHFRELVKSVIYFGPVAKEFEPSVIIIVDDCTVNWDRELTYWYREEVARLLASQKYFKELNINTITLSVFIDEIINCEPTAINVLRYGEPLIDFGGFFSPLKILLARGKIKPTAESVFSSLRRGPIHITQAKMNVAKSIENIHLGMVDSGNAALMSLGYVPPSPHLISKMLVDIFVKSRALERKHVRDYDEIGRAAENVALGRRVFLSAKDIDKYVLKARAFQKEMQRIVVNIMEKEK